MTSKHLFKGMAMIFMAVLSISACTETVEPAKPIEPDSLSVEPTDRIIFKNKGNEDVVLKVTTNVESWEYHAPEWIDATMTDTTLVLNVLDNMTEDPRLGRIDVTAGEAAPVKINVRQSGIYVEDDDVVVTGPEAVIVAKTDEKYAFSPDGKVVLSVKMTVAEAPTKAMTARLVFDPTFLEEYNFTAGTECILFPEVNLSMDDNVLIIPEGATESNELQITCNIPSDLKYGVEVLVPFKAKPVDNISFTNTGKRANFIVWRHTKKQIRNVVFYEVNETNPLNTLEYVLEDGTPFFDAVVLFSANIRWNSEDKFVYLHNNNNVQALLDETDVYLQPLREKGIKVYLGLLGDHTPAGLCNLTDWGAQQWSMEIARAIKQYKLDGVCLDDEYTEGSVRNKWIGQTSAKAGSRLCYELKKAMAKTCDWPTEVSYYVQNTLKQCTDVEDLETHEIHKPVDFIDFYVNDYGSGTWAYGGLTLQNCCAMSCQMNMEVGAVSETSARRFKEQGYGWIMYFAFDPSPKSNISNYKYSLRMFKGAARGMYDQELLDPKGYYIRVGDGQYDPTLYPFE